MNELDSRTARRILAIQAATTDKALSANEIGAAVFLHPNSALDYVRTLMATNRLHIELWRQVYPGVWVASYRWGEGKSKRKPRPRTHAESERARIKRIKSDPDAHARFLSMHRARYAVTKAKKTPATWLSALGAP